MKKVYIALILLMLSCCRSEESVSDHHNCVKVLQVTAVSEFDGETVIVWVDGVCYFKGVLTPEEVSDIALAFTHTSHEESIKVRVSLGGDDFEKIVDIEPGQELWLRFWRESEPRRIEFYVSKESPVFE